MTIVSHKAWQLEDNDTETAVDSIAALRDQIAASGSSEGGRLSVSADAGPRPLWQRLLGANRYVEMFFAVEWYQGHAALIFYDENSSEYRALDKEHPVAPSPEIRARISHGESEPCPSEECMSQPRAFRALAEFLQSGTRPTWLSYRYVR